MTRLTMLRLGVFSALALLPGNCLAGATPRQTAAYVEGTISTIPLNTAGSLDLADEEKLRFRYGQSAYEVPYDNITSFELGRKREGGFASRITGGAAKIGRSALPMFFSKKKHLAISFTSKESADTQQMVFQVPGDVGAAAIAALKSRTTEVVEAGDPAGETVKAAVLSPDDSWWGNRIWRTSRNQHLWPKAPEAQSGEPQQMEVAARDE